MSEKQHLSVTLHLKQEGNGARVLATLLQRGFLIPISGETTLAQLLIPLPGFSDKYLQDRVQTIFVNGLSEDNLDRNLFAGDTLALSAAMPGLAGAIFRRGGQHASLRTRPEKIQHRQNTSGFITLKLFNMIAMETGMPLLQNGIILNRDILLAFFKARGETLRPLIRIMEINCQPENFEHLFKIIQEAELIYLTMLGGALKN
jgi:hypothetical protein